MSLTRASASVIKTEEIVGTRNRIINGAMEIDQRNAGASVTISTDNIYTLDRWLARTDAAAASKYSIQQNAGSVTPPVGFTNYLGVTSLSSYSSSSTNYYFITQYIEGFNIADLDWGTANAKTVTLSFQVYSSLTGTFSGSIINGGFNRSYPFTYSIPVANTWTTVSVTIAGDTTGTWLTNNGRGLQTRFNLGSGSSLLTTANSWQAGSFIGVTDSVSVVGTNGATFYITGVQLEKGSTATPFERRQFGTELALCQRYYYKTATVATGIISTGAFADSTTSFSGYANFPVRLRATPTALSQSGTAGDYSWNGTSGIACSAVPGFSTRTTTDIWQVNFTVASGLTAGHGGSVITSNGNGFLAWSAEL